MAPDRWPGDSSDSRESPQTCASHFSASPEAQFAKEGIQFGNPEMIRENRAIRTDLQIDLHESANRFARIGPSEIVNALVATNRFSPSTIHMLFAQGLLAFIHSLDP